MQKPRWNMQPVQAMARVWNNFTSVELFRHARPRAITVPICYSTDPEGLTTGLHRERRLCSVCPGRQSTKKFMAGRPRTHPIVGGQAFRRAFLTVTTLVNMILAHEHYPTRIYGNAGRRRRHFTFRRTAG